MVMSPVRLRNGDVMMVPAPQVVAFNLMRASQDGARGVRARRKIEANLVRGRTATSGRETPARSWTASKT